LQRKRAIGRKMDLTSSEHAALVKIISFIKSGMEFIKYVNKRMALIWGMHLQPVHLQALFLITA
jgi:hypothetical protein